MVCLFWIVFCKHVASEGGGGAVGKGTVPFSHFNSQQTFLLNINKKVNQDGVAPLFGGAHTQEIEVKSKETVSEIKVTGSLRYPPPPLSSLLWIRIFKILTDYRNMSATQRAQPRSCPFFFSFFVR